VGQRQLVDRNGDRTGREAIANTSGAVIRKTRNSARFAVAISR
jgi:hypothetical protein